MTKQFTVEEANRTLPLVRRIVTDIVVAYKERAGRIKEYGHLDHDLKDMQIRRRELDAELNELTDRINGYIEELEAIGVQFKGFEPGLVDFPSVLDGRAVLLCWKLGEGQVTYYHEPEAGFAGRQRLPEHLAPHDDDSDIDAAEADDAER
jgi:hypothetical protein